MLLVGGDTVIGARVAAGMASFRGRFAAVPAGAPFGAEPFDLAVLACDSPEVSAALRQLAAAGTTTAVCLTPAPDLAAAAEEAGVRALGPASFGLIVPAIGLNASTAHVPVAPGRVALVSQSAALCRAVLDWAGPNGVGFSHVVGIGGNAQTGFNVTLDWLSRDPDTGAILLDIRSVRDPRTFLAAARAAARLRPVVTVRAGGRLHDPSGREDAVLDAALRRAGVLRVSSLAEFLGAAEVLTRARPARSARLVIASNAIGPAHLGADRAVALGLDLLEIDDAARSVLQLRLPPGPADPGIVWTGAAEPMRVAEAASLLAGVPATGGVVAVLAPTGPGDAAAVAALAAARRAMRVPLLVCIPGETTAAGHRRTLAEAGVPVFATPEAAVTAFAHLVRQRQVRAAAAELPPRRVLAIAPDHAAVAGIIGAARAAGRAGLAQDEALLVLAAYGIPAVPTLPAATAGAAAAAAAVLGFPAVVKRRRDARPERQGVGQGVGGLALDLQNAEAVAAAASRLLPAAPLGLVVQRQAGRARELRITVGDDPLFGPAIGFGLGGSAADLLGDASFDLPPLNLPLARSLIGRTRAGALMAAGSDLPEADRDAVADVLVRVSQLLVDHPEIAALDLNPLFATPDGAAAADAWIGLRPPGTEAALAILPYPAELERQFDARGTPVLIRPIRPEDAEAHAALFRRLTPEDIRFRFFNMLRELPAEQVVRMTQVDYDREMAFVAVREDGDTVAVCRLVREPGTDEAEFAVVVEPALKGRGLAGEMMRRVLDWGRTRGIRLAVGQVLAENRPMLGFMRSIGAAIRRLPDEPEVVEAVIRLD